MPQLNELEAYQKMVDFMALKNSTEILANAGAGHAAIAMSKLFDVTKNEVKMVVGSFQGAISNDKNYLKALKNCVEVKNVKFKIIFLDSPNTESSKALDYLVLKKGEKKNITFKQASPQFVAQLSKSGEPKHFSVYDNDKFRFEKDTINYHAWFSFNNKHETTELTNIFNAEFNRLPELDLQFA
jgi:hypothetical protein